MSLKAGVSNLMIRPPFYRNIAIFGMDSLWEGLRDGAMLDVSGADMLLLDRFFWIALAISTFSPLYSVIFTVYITYNLA